jgi:SAM-dependent methyltransferase
MGRPSSTSSRSGGNVTRRPRAAAESRYDTIPDLGLLYDNVPLYASRADVGFYVREATQTDGRVLELGCGTGRILLPIARAGRTITGIDSSREMLARCSAKLLEEPESVRARVTLQADDVRSFDLGKTFDLVIAPFRVVQHLTAVEDQLQFLQTVARHLSPRGRFIFDVFNPNFSRLIAVDGTEQEDTPVQTLADGRSFRRAARLTRVRWLDQVTETELIYYVSAAPGAAPRRYIHSFDMRWYLRAELLHLLARAGFAVEAIYGDFDYSPQTDGSPEQVVIVRRL